MTNFFQNSDLIIKQLPPVVSHSTELYNFYSNYLSFIVVFITLVDYAAEPTTNYLIQTIAIGSNVLF